MSCYGPSGNKGNSYVLARANAEDQAEADITAAGYEEEVSWLHTRRTNLMASRRLQPAAVAPSLINSRTEQANLEVSHTLEV